MSAEYSVKEILGSSEHYPGCDCRLCKILKAYANRVKADESAVMFSKPFGYAYRYADGIKLGGNGGERNGMRPIEAIPLFTRPPVQAAQIPELRIGAPAWPGQREGKAPPEGWVHVSVNNLSTHPHSPDAADSGRVTRLDIAAIDLLREIDSHREWVKSGSVLQAAQRMKLALAAQGKGEAVAATDADIAEWAERHDLNFGGSKTDARTAFEDAESYRRAHAASPAGVPDGNAKWIAKAVPLLKAAVSWMPTKKCGMHIREIDALLRAAPSATPIERKWTGPGHLEETGYIDSSATPEGGEVGL